MIYPYLVNLFYDLFNAMNQHYPLIRLDRFAKEIRLVFIGL